MNPEFKPVEFDGFKKLAGLNSFTLTPQQWIESTKAIGLVSKAGRYGGTYAQKDIAFEFPPIGALVQVECAGDIANEGVVKVRLSKFPQGTPVITILQTIKNYPSKSRLKIR